MGKKFRGDKKSGGRRDFGGRDSGGGFSGGDRQMFKAVCDDCGQSCEVPFRPTGDKPIYCSDCFRGKRGGDSRGSGSGRRERPSFGGDRDRSDRQMYSAVCSGCGSKCEVPFRPTGDKPVYCNDCFDKNKGSGASKSGGDGQLKNQIDAINAKLDKILKILDPASIVNIPKNSEIKKAAKEAVKKIAEEVQEIKPEIKKAEKKAKKVVAKKVAVKKKK